PCSVSCHSSSAAAPPALSAVSLHDALPISPATRKSSSTTSTDHVRSVISFLPLALQRNSHCRFVPSPRVTLRQILPRVRKANHRSEEHTSELQSRFDLVCRLLLEKKKTKTT